MPLTMIHMLSGISYDNKKSNVIQIENGMHFKLLTVMAVISFPVVNVLNQRLGEHKPYTHRRIVT